MVPFGVEQHLDFAVVGTSDFHSCRKDLSKRLGIRCL